MKGEDKYLRLKDELRFQTAEVRKMFELRIRSAKWSLLFVTAALLLLLIVTETPVFILFAWIAAMLIICAYLILLSFLSNELQTRFGDLAHDDSYDEEDSGEDVEEESESNEAIDAQSYEEIFAEAKRVVADK